MDSGSRLGKACDSGLYRTGSFRRARHTYRLDRILNRARIVSRERRLRFCRSSAFCCRRKCRGIFRKTRYPRHNAHRLQAMLLSDCVTHQDRLERIKADSPQAD